MRTGFLAVGLLLMLALVSLLPRTGPVSNLVTPTASCFDCSSVESTCATAAFAFYDACKAGGGDEVACGKDTMTWFNNCLRANGCQPWIDRSEKHDWENYRSIHSLK